MQECINEIKEALRIIDAKYVSSEQKDEYDIIRFTYKNRNYILNIISKYKLMILEQIESCIENKIDDISLGLLEDIDIIKSYMLFHDYHLLCISLSENKEKDVIRKKLEFKDTDENMIIAFKNKTIENQEELKVKLIEYNEGLNSFDNRLFIEDWVEDFNEKISVYSLEELYIIYNTLVSYFSKVVKNIWEGDLIDPFVINYFIEVVLQELYKRNVEIDSWYNEYSNYFAEINIEEYLNNKDKRKELN